MIRRISPKIAGRLVDELQDGGGKLEGAALDACRRYRARPTPDNGDAAIAALNMLDAGRLAVLRQVAGL